MLSAEESLAGDEKWYAEAPPINNYRVIVPKFLVRYNRIAYAIYLQSYRSKHNWVATYKRSSSCRGMSRIMKRGCSQTWISKKLPVA